MNVISSKAKEIYIENQSFEETKETQDKTSD